MDPLTSIEAEHPHQLVRGGIIPTWLQGYKPAHKEQTRVRIIAAAGDLFRRHGYGGVGIDHIMAAAKLTRGGFYSYFPSKSALSAEAFSAATAATRQTWLDGLDDQDEATLLRHLVGRYLSRTHRDAPGIGCAFASLSAELGRGPEATRRAHDAELTATASEIATRLGDGRGQEAYDRALALIALCVGGMSLARAAADEVLSDRLLQACRRYATRDLAN